MNACPVRMTMVGATEPALTFCRGSEADGGLSGDIPLATPVVTTTSLNCAGVASAFPGTIRSARIRPVPAKLVGDPAAVAVDTAAPSAAGDAPRSHALSAVAINTRKVVAFISDSVEVSQETSAKSVVAHLGGALSRPLAALGSGLVIAVVHPSVIELGLRHHPVPGMRAAHMSEVALVIRNTDNGANE